MIIVIGCLFIFLSLAESLKVDITNRGCSLTYHLINSTYVFDYCQFNATLANSNPSWLECCGTCCHLSNLQFPVFERNSLHKCMNTVESNSAPSPIMFVLVSLVSAVGLLIIVYVIFKAVKKMRGSQIRPFQSSECTAIGQYQWQSSNQMEQEHLQTEINVVSKQDKCAICLEDNPNAKLPCLHWFHFNCFLHWMQRTKECPLCRNRRFTKIIVYCKECKSRYTSIPFKSAVIVIDGLLSTGFGKCDHCRRIQQGEQSFQVIKKEAVL